MVRFMGYIVLSKKKKKSEESEKQQVQYAPFIPSVVCVCGGGVGREGYFALISMK